MNLKSLKHLIQVILEVKVILKKIILRIIKYFNQYKDILKELLILVMVITFIIGKLKDYLMKQLILLRYLIMKLLHAYSIQFDGGCLKQYQGTILHVGTVNVYIVYDISKSINIIDYPTLEYCLLRAVKLTKNAGIDKYGHYGYRI